MYGGITNGSVGAPVLKNAATFSLGKYSKIQIYSEKASFQKKRICRCASKIVKSAYAMG